MSNVHKKYSELISPLHTLSAIPEQVPVLIRADCNVPIEQNSISDEFRLQRFLPTIDALLTRTDSIRLLTHFNRPGDPLSHPATQLLTTWFHEHGYPITIAENVRYDKREYLESTDYAEELKHGAQYYIDDAFGVIHEHHTSLTTLARLFPVPMRGIGLLMESELTRLGDLIRSPQHPILVVMGGGKKHKLNYLDNLLHWADSLLLCPALSQYAREPHGVPPSKNHKIHFPIDYLVSEAYPWQPPFTYCDAQHAHSYDPRTIIAVGPRTIDSWKPLLQSARTIIFNGPMGDSAIPATTETLHDLLGLIAHSDAYSVIGGGDSVYMSKLFGMISYFSYCSTGGGSLLAYLSGAPLPGLDIFTKDEL